MNLKFLVVKLKSSFQKLHYHPYNLVVESKSIEVVKEFSLLKKFQCNVVLLIILTYFDFPTFYVFILFMDKCSHRLILMVRCPQRPYGHVFLLTPTKETKQFRCLPSPARSKDSRLEDCAPPIFYIGMMST